LEDPICFVAILVELVCLVVHWDEGRGLQIKRLLVKPFLLVILLLALTLLEVQLLLQLLVV
jgi:hypothetical protein